MSLVVQQIGNNSYIDLARFDVSAVNVGFQVTDIITGNFFCLAVSNSTVDHVAVESVKGQPLLRWLKTGQNANVPIGGGVIPPNQIFVTRDGSDSNTGLAGSPLKTASAGYLALMALGGGTLTVEHLSWASPVSGAGLWVSGTFDVGTAPSPWVKAADAFPWQLEMIPGTSAQDDFAQGQLAPGGGASTFNGPVLQVAGYLQGFVCSNLLAYVSPSIDAVTYFPACRVGLLFSARRPGAPARRMPRTLSVVGVGRQEHITSLVDSNTGNDPTTSPSFWIRCQARRRRRGRQRNRPVIDREYHLE